MNHQITGLKFVTSFVSNGQFLTTFSTTGSQNTATIGATQVSLSDLSRGSRLGSKVINCKDVSFYYGGKCYLDHFTYNFQRFDRVGIVGRNGCGKTTFINLLTGNMYPDDPGVLTGEIDRGESLNIGYYHQSGIKFDEDQTVLETVLPGIELFPCACKKTDSWRPKP